MKLETTEIIRHANWTKQDYEAAKRIRHRWDKANIVFYDWGNSGLSWEFYVEDTRGRKRVLNEQFDVPTLRGHYAAFLDDIIEEYEQAQGYKDNLEYRLYKLEREVQELKDRYDNTGAK